MSSPTKEEMLEQLRTVDDPELHEDLVSLDMVKNVAVCDGVAKVQIELTTPACPMKDTIRKDVEAALYKLEGMKSVEVEFTARVRSSRPEQSQLPGVKNIIAVGAGKGGVGKSVAAVLLAVGLRRAGATVGLMDADVYGPSIPTMMGAEDARPQIVEERIIPIEAGDIKLMSIGFLVDRNKPVIWRGPMVHGVVKQFLDQVEWGELDYLIVDLPPGTGDVPLTLAQSIPMSGSVVICTPQDIALMDARRAVSMYEQLKVDCLGVIENMSYYICPKCGHRDEIFDHGGVERAAVEMGVPFLGAIPLNADIRKYTDGGHPERNWTEGQADIVKAIDGIVANVAGRISVRSASPVAGPTLSVE